MSEKRKDKKGRILRTGEQQRADGRYMYAYRDASGGMAYAYSWRLEPTDRIPAGKRDCESLREKEKKIQKDLADGIICRGGDLTVLELVEKYLKTKSNIRDKTKANYEFIKNIIQNDEFGTKRIDKVRMSDAKAWIVKLKNEDRRGYSCIKAVRSVVKPAFRMAVDDDLIRKNPFDFMLSEVIDNNSAEREALTKEEMDSFLGFIKKDKYYRQYYDGVFILFNTGMRVSEFCGLTINDIDIENKKVNIERQLQKMKGRYKIEKTKTGAGKRVLVITDEVCESFRRLMSNRINPETELIVDGKSGFICLDKNGMPTVAMHWEKRFKSIKKKYEQENGEFPKPITPHVCRHTYATINALAGMNPKVLQYMLGHSDIRTSLNIYSHIEMDSVEQEVERIKQEIK